LLKNLTIIFSPLILHKVCSSLQIARGSGMKA
jgi:hypothetical protein